MGTNGLSETRKGIISNYKIILHLIGLFFYDIRKHGTTVRSNKKLFGWEKWAHKEVVWAYKKPQLVNKNKPFVLKRFVSLLHLDTQCVKIFLSSFNSRQFVSFTFWRMMSWMQFVFSTYLHSSGHIRTSDISRDNLETTERQSPSCVDWCKSNFENRLLPTLPPFTLSLAPVVASSIDIRADPLPCASPYTAQQATQNDFSR